MSSCIFFLESIGSRGSSWKVHENMLCACAILFGKTLRIYIYFPLIIEQMLLFKAKITLKNELRSSNFSRWKIHKDWKSITHHEGLFLQFSLNVLYVLDINKPSMQLQTFKAAINVYSVIVSLIVVKSFEIECVLEEFLHLVEEN